MCGSNSNMSGTEELLLDLFTSLYWPFLVVIMKSLLFGTCTSITSALILMYYYWPVAPKIGMNPQEIRDHNNGQRKSPPAPFSFGHYENNQSTRH